MLKIRVLIVEDASFMRETLKRGLRTWFSTFEIDEAIHGKDAQAKLDNHSYDLILCDWEMPEMTGAELLIWIRQSPQHAKLPFIMITSRGDRKHVMKAVELKANNYIVKPFTNEKLIGVVSKVLSKSLRVSAKALRGFKEKSGSANTTDPDQSSALLIAETLTTTKKVTAAIAKPVTKTKSDVVFPKGKLIVNLRAGANTLHCLAKEVGKSRFSGVIRRNDEVPNILDLVVLDIEHEGEIARINGYVHTLQAREESQETEFINIIVYLVDKDDPDKMIFLEKFMRAIA